MTRKRGRPAAPATSAWIPCAGAAALATAVLACGGASPRAAGPPDAPAPLRIATSVDYRPFGFLETSRSARAGAGAVPGLRPVGFGPSLARAFARSAGGSGPHAAAPSEAELVPFAWQELLADLAAGRFDFAVGGITVRPERSVAGRFTVPVATSGAVLLLRGAAGCRPANADPQPRAASAPGPSTGTSGCAARIEALDRAGVRIAVNRGGHLERVARRHFEAATIVAIAPNPRVLDALIEGRVEAVVTDTLEAPHWRAEASRRGRQLVALGPFTQDRKAWLVRADRPELARRLDRWLIGREGDGTLAAARRRWLGAGAGPPTALPLPALIAACDERLALMPSVAEAKRSAGVAVRDAAREALVVRAGVEAVRDAARRSGEDPPPEPAVRAFYRAQIDAARAVQRATLAAPPSAHVLRASLGTALRPALLRIGDRMAMLLVAVSVQPAVQPEPIAAQLRAAIAAPGFTAGHAEQMARAIAALAQRPQSSMRSKTTTGMRRSVIAW